jgi:2-(1,2-epoxy-1,2-dihydrophenyl)acetyl-CoA isomerase
MVTPRMSDFLHIEDRGDVRWIILDRPRRKNAIPRSGWGELAVAFAEFEASGSRVLVITGAGSDFCSGADLADAAAGFPTSSPAETTVMMQTVAAAALALHRISKPTVAAVDGVAVGAGMNLALGCDLVIASERARFAEVFVGRGLTLDFGGTWLLSRLVGLARARELALTGREVGAAEALRIGLVAQVVPPGELVDAATGLATRLAAGAPLAQRFTKAALGRVTTMTFEQALEHESQAQAVLLASDDVREGVAAFLEKRPARFRGS